MSAADLLDAVRTADQAHGLFVAGETVVVAVSGGADSLALLVALRAYAPERRLSLHVAHLDHLLRPDSTADAAYVASLASAWSLPATVEAVDVEAVALSRGGGLEEAARHSRYTFLAHTAARIGAGSVAVAHTADDQAETVLMNLIRGSGLAGLSAMRPRSTLPLPDNLALPLIRPLLTVRRSDVVAYLARHGLVPRMDASNHDPRFLRNRLRQEVLPILSDLNPNVTASLLRLALGAAEDAAYLEAVVDQAWPQLVRESEGRLVADRAAWRLLPVALQRRVLRRMAERLLGRSRDFGWEAVGAARTACLGEAPTQRSLPGGLRLIVREDEVVLQRAPSEIPPLKLGPADQALAVPGTTPLPGGWTLTVTVRLREPTDGRTTTWQCHLDGDRSGVELRVRSRRPGDALAPLGMGGRHRRLQDVLVDARVPLGERDHWPLVIAGTEIAWVVGVRQSEHSRVRPDSRRVVVLEAQPPAHLRWPA